MEDEAYWQQWDVRWDEVYPGRKYGRLTVKALTSKRWNKQRVYRCECSCGKQTFVRASHLKTGQVVSCVTCSRETGS